MRLTDKLLGFLHRIFDKDPHSFLALRLRYNGAGMTWRIADGVLTTEVAGGIGGNLEVDLSQFSVRTLVSYLTDQPGYSVVFADFSNLADLSSLVLIDGEGDQNASNGDHLRGYTSLLWSYLEANAVELTGAQTQIVEMRKQMEIPSASDDWIDEHGSYYGIRRGIGEADNYYGPRIIVEVLRPRGNNVAIEKAIAEITGQEVTVTDVTLYDDDLAPLHNNTISYDGSAQHNAIGNPIYGLFDVDYGYDLEDGPDVAEYVATVAALVETLRDAGTHLRSLSLVGGSMVDVAAAPSTDSMVLEVGAPLVESDDGPSAEDLAVDLSLAQFTDSDIAHSDEEAGITVDYDHLYDGLRSYNGIILHRSGSSVEEPL